MDKNSWYYENIRTGEFTDVRTVADRWVEGGDFVNYWHWSEFFQDFEVLMMREP